jgi:hypothetical protein
MLNTEYWETSNWRQKYLNKKWLNKDRERNYKEIMIKNVKGSCNRTGVTQRVPEGFGSQISMTFGT